ncbi:hypothetical protein ABH007_11700 [Bacteroides thetaiotaomicron]|uniref:hypothetical protein n=1 Tax=Bacteroides thetaiotaomicron TaxID=818 RepID=UPI0023308324|nr:hypothetical protein [Bacteroides thetaiotaomicron]MDC2013061.1 hypothetical protein [Bacteroides thetaiotaomicron]MDC2017599.1 hypothetical protein [Bacteroides thetaiotaomicron]MDC2035557.1 hypothetical protein [Bacteroides thetaiotaomicron]MDC2039858.1 hypothetical protein [Bacteroides thetaiotaomicron]MDC2044510.1 hypothetical protein [Bacteroides thetaiotaomicron]
MTGLVAYHDDYAKVMQKYGLQRGVPGSKARHITTSQYYRDLKRQSENLEINIQELEEKKTETRKELQQVKNENRIDKLKGVATDTATAFVSSVSSLFGGGKLDELKKENRQLNEEVACRDESIENLQGKIRKLQSDHNRQLFKLQEEHRSELLNKETKHREEILRFTNMIEKACT